MRWLIGTLAVLAASVGARTLLAQEEQPIVREIEVRFLGPETVNRAVINANIQTVVGQPRSRDVVEQDVRNLIGTGYFFDVRVLEEAAADGVKIVFQVQGKATIKELLIQGQNRFKEERLRRELKAKPGDIFDERKIHDGGLKIVEIYQKAGFPDATVGHEVSIDKDTSKAIVRVKITEGARVYLKRIQFVGNKAFPERQLTRLLKTKRRWWGSWLAGTGVLRDEQLHEDLDKLRDFYRSHGYMDFEIRDTKVERVKAQWIVVRIELFEGVQYKVGEIKIDGAKLFPVADLEKRLHMTTGLIFTPDALSKDLKSLEDYYGARGYLDTAVNSVRTPNVGTGRIDLTYKIHEGELMYIEKIEIRGNTKTKDKVIRRELAVAPGAVFDTVRVERSAERLKNLGYFSKVETIPEPTNVPNRKDLGIELEEQRTGTVTFGAGFSSIDSLLGFVEVTQGNFDLFNWPAFTGGGQKLRIRAQLGFKRQDYTLSFTEPWFLDQRLSLGFDLYHHSSSFLSTRFDEQRTGGDLRLEKALNDFMRVSLQYSLDSITEGVSTNSSLELRTQNGSHTRSALSASLVFDARDSVFLTTRGNRTELSTEVAGGPLGGDVSDYKLNAKTTFYIPLSHGHVLELLAAGGVVDAYGATRGDGPFITQISGTKTNVVKVNDVPIFDRYFLGGANTLRGFAYRKVGPKDIQQEPVGGNTEVHATAEYSFPIVERVRGAVFLDVGEVERNAYSFDIGDLRSDAGLGVRLNLPIGPIRLDYGYPLMTDKHSGHTGKIQFSVGYQF